MTSASAGKGSTAIEALQGRRLVGLTAIVTGANSGIGVETARALAFAGANVVLACRSATSGAEVAAKLQSELPAGAGRLEVAPLDLSDLRSVREFTQKFLSAGRPLDLLINNAGVMASPFTRTAQGLESQLGVNHLGHFVLTVGLLPALAPNGRVINVASAAHSLSDGKKLLATLTAGSAIAAAGYSRSAAYNDSKLANVLFTNGLSRRLAPGQSTYAVHPGVIGTNLARSLGVMGKVFVFLLKLFSKTPAQGAATSVYAATAPELEGHSGGYLADCALKQCSAQGHDVDLAEQLWAGSERLARME